MGKAKLFPMLNGVTCVVCRVSTKSIQTYQSIYSPFRNNYFIQNENVVLYLQKTGKRKHQQPFVEVSRGRFTPANCRRAINKLVVPGFVEVKVLDGGLDS